MPLLARVAPIALMGIGMTFVIIAGGIDVSVGSMLMVSAVVTAKMLVDINIPLVLALVVSIAVGALLGTINGLLITRGRVHAIIITFGTLNLFQFLGRQVFDSNTVNGIPPTLEFFGLGDAGITILPHSFMLMIVIGAAAWWYLRNGATGRHYYAIGGDPGGAELAGVNVKRRVTFAYVLTGALVGLAAIVTLANGTSNLDQTVGSGDELAVIAATVIGGTSILGGRGSVLGTILGALLVQTIASGVTQLGWPSQMSGFFIGVFVLVAVGADVLRAWARKRK